MIFAVQQAMKFAAPERLWFLLLLPIAWILIYWGWRSRQRAQKAWAGSLFDQMAPAHNPQREWLKFSLFLLATAFIVLAVARPQWGGETVKMKRRGIDLFIAIDTSMSMLAEDVSPNRLEQAKRGVSDLIHEMRGDRVGLIAFAGAASTVCPLTLDHGTVLLLLESLDVNSVSTPGTNVGDAIKKARASFVAGEEKHKALLIVTDGESHEGDIWKQVETAKNEGLVIYTIGVGSPEGEPIPERNAKGRVAGYKRSRDGKVVQSKLDETSLRKMAFETNGQYFRGTTRGLELAAVYEDLQSMEKKELEGTLSTSYEERFRWPLSVALILLGLELILPSRKRKLGESV